MSGTSDFLIPKRRYSYSQWEAYDDCPQKWKFRSIDRLPQGPSGPAAQRGQLIHDSIESYINGADRSVLHPDIHPDYVEVFDEYRHWPTGDRWAEREFGVTPDWKMTGKKEPDSRLMAVLDVVGANKNIVDIGEWKSGKPKDRHVEQRKIYACVGMTYWPHAEQIIVTTHYVENTAPSEKLIVSPRGAQKLMKIWDQRFDRMDSDKICGPRPGFYCRWCDYSREKGGPCKVG